MPQPMYGQVVVGPPGSGKTTFCDGMQQYLRMLGRDAWVINFDPANEGTGKRRRHGIENNNVSKSTRGDKKETVQNSDDEPDHAEDSSSHNQLPYETLFDICNEVINLSSVMLETGLGPNGGLMYCMEYLEAHSEAIILQLQERLEHSTPATNDESRKYLIFDLPGQVELYTHSTCVQHVLHRLVKTLDLRLTAVQLVDAHYCTDASKFLSASLLGTTTMLRLELPTVNVLSKIDLLASYGELPMQLEYFTDCHDLDKILPFLDNPMPSSMDDGQGNEDFDVTDDAEYQCARQRRRQSKLYRKFEKLHSALAEVVEDYGLLSFIPLNISNAESVGRVLAQIDKCNGYVFVNGSVNEDLFRCAIQADNPYENIADIKELLMKSENIPELQR